jgi:F-type H+-transporting ATPase subunit b
MLVDWFTVGAQALNFLVLVWLMKRFLYRPILDAIDAREKRVAGALADAEAKQVEAARERAEFEHRKEDLERQRTSLLEQAAKDAEAERRRLIDAARQAADAAREQQRAALRSETQRLQQALARRTQDEVFAITRKVLGDLASASLDERAVSKFIARLGEADAATWAAAGESMARSAEPALVRSAFELSAEERARLQATLDRLFSRRIALRFETAPDLVGGIELSANGHKLAWSIASYLASLRTGIDQLTASRAAPIEKRG